MKKTLLTLLALGSSVVFLPQPAQAQRVSIGIGIDIGRPGGPVRYYSAPPRAPRVRYKPARPARGWVWVPGYYMPAGRAWRWTDGYWAQPPRGAKKWVQPRYRGNYYYSGYWR